MKLKDEGLPLLSGCIIGWMPFSVIYFEKKGGDLMSDSFVEEWEHALFTWLVL